MTFRDLCKDHGLLRCKECAYTQQLKDEIKELQEENKSLNKIIKDIGYPLQTSTVIQRLSKKVDELKDENKHYHELLEENADEFIKLQQENQRLNHRYIKEYAELETKVKRYEEALNHYANYHVKGCENGIVEVETGVYYGGFAEMSKEPCICYEAKQAIKGDTNE